MSSRRSVSLAAALFATLTVSTLFLAAPLEGQQRRALSTQLSAPAGIKPTGRLPGSQPLKLALTLPLRNQAELQSLLHDLYNPGSPSYRHFLSVEEFTERFGPTQEDYEKVTAFAQANGLTVTQTAPNRLVLDVSGPVSAVESAFHVNMQVYRHPTETRTFYAPNVEPSVDASLPVQAVSGLSTLSPARPADRKFVPLGEGSPQNTGGSGPGGYFRGSDLRAAYAPGVTLDGSGQVIGLFEEMTYDPADVQLTFSSSNQTVKVPIINVLLDGLSGVCTAVCTDDEAVLDIVYAISMAPNLSALLVYEGGSDVDIFNRMATDNIAKQLSVSFDWGPDPSSVEPIFLEFAAQGQSLFAASGDGGAYSSAGCTLNCTNALFPASDPYVTAVGGTSLTTASPGGAWASESAWVGSGGGISSYPIQSYQVPLIDAANQGSTTLRNVPDVAADAYPDNYICADLGTCGTAGGTSLATPVWAGFAALANQQANGASIGFLNPSIYALAQGANYSNQFHDIASGNNFNTSSPSLFSAVAGYDLVTGLGSPNGQALLNALAPATTSPNFTLAASPGALSVTPGAQANSTIAIGALNGFSSAVNLSAKVLGQIPGVTVGLSPASVTGAGTSVLTVAVANSSIVPSIQIAVTAISGGITHSAFLTLTVEMPVLVETAISAPPASLTANSSFSITDTVQNSGVAPAGASVTGFYLSATTSKTSESLLLGSRAVPSLAVNAVSTGTVNGTVPSGLWPNTPYYLLACANDTGAVVETSANNCATSATTTISAAPAPPATTTTLSLTSGGSAVSTVAQGSVVTLTATVTNGSTPVTRGQVNFCDAAAPLCTDIHLLGTAQLAGAGTATLKLRPGTGTYRFKAVFRGTIGAGESSSNVEPLTVTGKYATQTTMAQSGSAGNYTLTATVTGSGAASPTGQVSFLDTSSGNSVLGTAALTAGVSDLSWTTPQTLAAEGVYDSVAVGDFNGDGIPDLVIPNYDQGTLTILMGNGDGTFRTAVTQALPDNPNFVVVGDFNGDGKLDIAVLMVAADGVEAKGSIAILLGNGDGTFTLSPVSLPTASHPEQIAASDFNHDGNQDLVVVSYNPNMFDGPGTLTVWLGNGDGTFTAAPSVATRNGPSSVVVGDFNGDGKDDLAVSNGEDGAITILLGNGDGTFTLAASPLTDLCSWSVATGDFNGDGKADLALVNTNANTVIILLGKGDGTFTPTTQKLSTGEFPADVIIGDFDGDGKADLAIVNTYSDTVTILLGNGDGTFTPASASPATATNSYAIAAGDFNGDGKSDLAAVNYTSASATILLSRQTATATATASGIAPLGTGTHLVEASYPGDSNYASGSSATTPLTATKKTPTIAWATPAPITAGTALGSAQLDASASVPGSFVYNPAAGTIPAVGNDTLSVAFTPNDTADYNTATASVTLVVNPPSNPVPAMAGISPAFTTAGGAAFPLTVSGTGFVSGSTVYWGTTALSTQFVSATQLTAQVTAGNLASAGTTPITVQSPAPGGGASNSLQFEVDTAGSTSAAPTFTSLTASVAAGATATYPVTLPSSATGVYATCLNLPSGATCAYSSTTNAVTIATSSSTPKGTYQVTVVFTATLPGAAVTGFLLPLLLLPLLYMRKRLAAKSLWMTVSLMLLLLIAAAFGTGCGGGGGGSTTTPPVNPTHQVTSSGTVGLTIQ